MTRDVTWVVHKNAYLPTQFCLVDIVARLRCCTQSADDGIVLQGPLRDVEPRCVVVADLEQLPDEIIVWE
jgi:hypothetical protein